MPLRMKHALPVILTIVALIYASAFACYAQSVTYSYDDLNRLTRIDYGNGTVIDYTYDDVGNRITENIHQLILPTTTASPAGGTYSTAQSVTLTCSDTGGPGCGNIYYTTDGSTPTTSSPVYSSAILISSNITLKYFARDISNPPVSEPVKTQVYTINLIVPTTVASPAGGHYNTSKSVTLTCSDPGGPGCDKIYYTTDGTTPTTSSPVYSSPINISATTTLKFFAKDLGGNSESVKTQNYIIDTTPPTGTVIVNSGAGSTSSPDVTLTLSCNDADSCYQVQFSNDNINWSTPEAYGTTKAWTLAPWDGNETVYVRFQDAAGNWSTVYSYTIVLNNNPANPAPVRIADTNYGTLQSAYNAAADGALIKCRAITFIESLTVNRNISVTLAGGYNSGFTINTGGQTTIQGSLTTTAGGGTITLGNLLFQQ